MNANILIYFLMIVCLVNDGSADDDNDRDKRSVQFLFEGIIDALTQKHLKSTASTKVLPFAGYTKQGLLSSNIGTIDRTSTKSAATLSPPVTQVPLIKAQRLSQDNNKDALMISTVNETQNGRGPPMKVMQPLANDSQGTSTSTVSSTDAPSTTTATMKTITPPCNEPEPSAVPPAMVNSQIMAEEAAMELENLTQAIEGTTAPAAGEERSAKTISADTEPGPPQSKFNYHPTQVVSDRHTQFWGNPLYFQAQYPQLIPYGPFYNDLFYNNVGPVPGPPPPPPPPPPRPLSPYPLLPTIPPKFGRYYLPPHPGSPVFVLPVPIPPPAIFFRNADNSHSRVKMHGSDYHQYVYHGTEPAQAQEPSVPNSVAEPDHHQGQATLTRRTYIDPYSNIESTNLIAAQSQVIPQIQAPQSTTSTRRQSTVRDSNVRKTHPKARPSSRLRDQSSPAAKIKSDQGGILHSLQQASAVQRPKTYEKLQNPLRAYPAAPIQSTQAVRTFPQTHVQYFGQKINGN